MSMNWKKFDAWLQSIKFRGGGTLHDAFTQRKGYLRSTEGLPQEVALRQARDEFGWNEGVITDYVARHYATNFEDQSLIPDLHSDFPAFQPKELPDTYCLPNVVKPSFDSTVEDTQDDGDDVAVERSVSYRDLQIAAEGRSGSYADNVMWVANNSLKDLADLALDDVPSEAAVLLLKVAHSPGGEAIFLKEFYNRLLAPTKAQLESTSRFDDDGRKNLAITARIRVDDAKRDS